MSGEQKVRENVAMVRGFFLGALATAAMAIAMFAWVVE